MYSGLSVIDLWILIIDKSDSAITKPEQTKYASNILLK